MPKASHDPVLSQGERFGQRVRDLRQERGWTQRQLADELSTALAAAGIEPVVYQSIGQWEKGQYQPRTRAVVRVLDQVLGGTGDLLAILDYAPDATTAERLAALEESQEQMRLQVTRMAKRVAELVKKLDAPADPPRRGRSR